MAVLLLGATLGAVAPGAAPATAEPPGRRVLLSEDFSGPTLDAGTWSVKVTDENNRIYGNELQAYAEDADVVYIDRDDAATGATNGALALHARARKTTVDYPTDKPAVKKRVVYDFVSGRIETEKKFDFTYGSMAARMKLPALPGTWPAFWSQGYDGWRWPANGEIDVMENVGAPGWTSSGIHIPGAGPPEENGRDEHRADRGYPAPDDPVSGRTNFAGFNAADWHVYRVDWSPAGLVFLVDEREWLRVTPEHIADRGSWVFDQAQYLLLNMAIGGNYPASVFPGAPGGVPDATRKAIERGGVRTLVDWVQVTENRPGQRIEAESADALRGIVTGPGPDGGGTAGSIAVGDVMRFDQVDFGTGSTGVRVRASSRPPRGQAGRMQLRADREDAVPFATVEIPLTDSWDRYVTVASRAQAPVGVHTVYATFTHPGSYDFVNIDWIEFDPPPQIIRGHWAMDAENEPRVADLAGRAEPLTLSDGVTWTNDVRVGRGDALRFDGVEGHAATTSPVVRTDQSFTVTAWARPRKSGGYYTVAAQEGTQASAFYLQYTAFSNRWAFSVTDADSADPAFRSAESGGPPDLDKWTHLAGVYDAAAGTITLYVNGVADPRVGSVTARLWNAPGPFTVGRSTFNGVPGNFWPGDIDDVRVVSGVLRPEQLKNLTEQTPA